MDEEGDLLGGRRRKVDEMGGADDISDTVEDQLS
jgi:hypothetical protein